MTTVLNINIDDIDTKFVENLKRDFAHAAVEIRLQEQFNRSLTFSRPKWSRFNIRLRSETIDRTKVKMEKFIVNSGKGKKQ